MKNSHILYIRITIYVIQTPYTVVSCRHTPDQVEIVIDEERTGRADAFSIEGWDIGEITAKLGTSSVSSGHRNLAAVRVGDVVLCVALDA